MVARLKMVFLFNDNPIPAARHFQYKVEVFLKEIIVDVPMDKKKYFAIDIEFQKKRAVMSIRLYKFSIQQIIKMRMPKLG